MKLLIISLSKYLPKEPPEAIYTLRGLESLHVCILYANSLHSPNVVADVLYKRKLHLG